MIAPSNPVFQYLILQNPEETVYVYVRRPHLYTNKASDTFSVKALYTPFEPLLRGLARRSIITTRTQHNGVFLEVVGTPSSQSDAYIL